MIYKKNLLSFFVTLQTTNDCVSILMDMVFILIESIFLKAYPLSGSVRIIILVTLRQ